MVASRDDGNAGAQKFDCDFARNPSAACCVLAVDDDEIQCLLFLKLRQPADHSVAPWLAHDVAEKKNRWHSASIVLKEPKSKRGCFSSSKRDDSSRLSQFICRSYRPPATLRTASEFWVHIPAGTCWKNIRKQLPMMSSPD